MNNINKAGIDIAANIKQIEKLKSAVLADVSAVFAIMSGDGEGEMEAHLASIIINAYMLGKKMGYDYNTIDENIMNMLKLSILSFDTPKQEYNELSDRFREKNR